MKLTQEDQRRVNDTLRARDIHPDQFKFLNCVRPHPTETDEHWEGKQKECRRLYKDGLPYLTEVWTRDRSKRYDILNLLESETIEIETGKSKNKKYTGDRVIFV